MTDHPRFRKLPAVRATLGFCVLALAYSGLTLHSALGQAAKKRAAEDHDWPVYGGAPEGTHYSSLAQINRRNVKKLQVAFGWGVRCLRTSSVKRDGK